MISEKGVYDTILNKPDVLTADEFELIKNHPILSRDIVAHIPTLTPCLPAILHHHERWDGKGYPHGLKGDKIPLEARILSVADSFDAMSSARPIVTECLLNFLKNTSCAGTQFEPADRAFLPIAIKVLNARAYSRQAEFLARGINPGSSPVPSPDYTEASVRGRSGLAARVSLQPMP
jgi:hypothetical protein